MTNRQDNPTESKRLAKCMRGLFKFLQACALTLAIIGLVPVVSQAYGNHLTINITDPTAALKPVPTGQIIGPIQATHVVNGVMVVSGPQGPMVQKSHAFFSQTVTNATLNRETLLWSVYPSNVRGRAFGSGDIFSRSGGWG